MGPSGKKTEEIQDIRESMLTQEDHDWALGKRQRKRRKSYTFLFRTQKKQIGLTVKICRLLHLGKCVGK